MSPVSVEGTRDLVIVSNRGPLSFRTADDGSLLARRGGGGLVSALGPAVAGSGATWIAGAITDGDRRAAAGMVEAEGFQVRSLVLDADDYRGYYDVVSSGALWFVHHRLYDSARRPRFDRHWYRAWESYRRINAAFARAVIDEAPAGALVLVQDYHLTLLAATLADERPDLTPVHFHHTPFGGPDDLRILPDEVGIELLDGLAAHAACGFQAPRWATAFDACCRELLGRPPCPTFVSPAAVEPAEIAKVAASEACGAALFDLERQVGDRRLIARVDRIELSKNLLRGFLAFEDLLTTHPQWREHVVFAAFVYPSREGLAEYLAYRQEVDGLVRRINQTWATPGWTPIVYDDADDFARSVAGLRRYDVLVVNPVRDGLNLVAKEGPLVNERDGVVVLSRESGAWSELGAVALGINPFDVTATSEVLHRALAMGEGERRDHARAVRALAGSRAPADWVADQVRAATSGR